MFYLVRFLRTFDPTLIFRLFAEGRRHAHIPSWLLVVSVPKGMGTRQIKRVLAREGIETWGHQVAANPRNEMFRVPLEHAARAEQILKSQGCWILGRPYGSPGGLKAMIGSWVKGPRR